MSYEVITVNLKSGEVEQASDTIYATNASAAASSLHRIALCGGKAASVAHNYCQMYSPGRDECVYDLDGKPRFSGLLSSADVGKVGLLGCKIAHMKRQLLHLSNPNRFHCLWTTEA